MKGFYRLNAIYMVFYMNFLDKNTKTYIKIKKYFCK